MFIFCSFRKQLKLGQVCGDNCFCFGKPFLKPVYLKMSLKQVYLFLSGKA